MAQFNRTDPRFQREMQKVAAQRSMGTSRRPGVLRSAIGEVTGRHAKHQLGRQLEFGRLAQQKRGSDIADQMNKARLLQGDRSLELQEDKLADEKSGLNFTLASGLGQIGLGYLQGRDRKTKLKESNETAERRHKEIIAASRGAIPFRPMRLF